MYLTKGTDLILPDLNLKIKPEPGNYYLFPPEVIHGTEKHEDEKHRYCIVFNIEEKNEKWDFKKGTMNYNHKISDLIYEIPNLLPKDICKDLINHYEEFSHLAWSEASLKYQTGEKTTDNFRCLNLSQFRFENKKIKKNGI